METKDWIVLFVPILCNGFIIFIFQKLLSNKMERMGKRKDIRDEVIKKFWNKLQNLNDTFIQVNLESISNPEVAGKQLDYNMQMELGNTLQMVKEKIRVRIVDILL